MRKKSLLLLIVAVATVIFFSNCRINPIDDIKTDNLNQEWAIPLIDTKKSFGDIINGFDPKAFIQIGTDSTVILRYKGNYITQSSLDVFANFRNVSFPILDSTMAVPFSLPSGVHIDYVDVKKGTLRWAIKNTLSKITFCVGEFKILNLVCTAAFKVKRLIIRDFMGCCINENRIVFSC